MSSLFGKRPREESGGRDSCFRAADAGPRIRPAFLEALTTGARKTPPILRLSPNLTTRAYAAERNDAATEQVMRWLPAALMRVGLAETDQPVPGKRIAPIAMPAPISF